MYFEKVYNDVIINNSIFYNNSYNDPKIAKEGYAIKIQTGNLFTLTNNCFYDNNFLGDGMILTNNTNITLIENNFAINNGEVDCPFIYDIANETCTKSDATACTIQGLAPIPIEYTTSSSDGGGSTPTAPTPAGTAVPPS